MKSAKSPEARSRLLDMAGRLFYTRGYYRTGVREIVKESRAAISSFYDHFSSKEEMATAYLRDETERTLANLQAIMARYPDIRDFARAWMLAKKKDIRTGAFVGCPFAGFVYQSAELDAAHRAALAGASERWMQMLAAFISENIDRGVLAADTDPRELAGRVLVIYQGAVAMWRLSGETRYIQLMQTQIQAELDARLAKGGRRTHRSSGTGGPTRAAAPRNTRRRA
jgi:AcrR family transcriptional regulator